MAVVQLGIRPIPKNLVIEFQITDEFIAKLYEEIDSNLNRYYAWQYYGHEASPTELVLYYCGSCAFTRFTAKNGHLLRAKEAPR